MSQSRKKRLLCSFKALTIDIVIEIHQVVDLIGSSWFHCGGSGKCWYAETKVKGRKPWKAQQPKISARLFFPPTMCNHSWTLSAFRFFGEVNVVCVSHFAHCNAMVSSALSFCIRMGRNPMLWPSQCPWRRWNARVYRLFGKLHPARLW